MPEVKYTFMDAHTGNFGVWAICRVLRVSRSGFYAWRLRQADPSPRQRRRRHLDSLVKQAFVARKGRSASPGLTRDLAEAGQRFDPKTVAGSMQRQALRAKAARKFKTTTDSTHTLAVAPNLLEQEFTATAPNQK
jgi:hypothetical protein